MALSVNNSAIELQRPVQTSQPSKESVPQASTTADTDETHRDEVEAVTKLSRADLVRLIVAGFAFFCSGINDGSLGPLIPYIIQAYRINTNFVSIVYGVTFFGWFTAAVTNSHMTQLIDLGLMLTIGAVLQLLAQCLRAWSPPFGLFAASFWFAHSGQGKVCLHWARRHG